MIKQVGYLVNHPGRLEGDSGSFYDYILAGNGVFIAASNPILSARIPVGECEVRGLAPVKPKITLVYGSIPQHFFDLALDTFLATPDRESYVAVVAQNGYDFYVPSQDQKEGSVTYNVGASVILDIHSHGHMRACFSSQDNRDESGLLLSAVVGNLRGTPQVSLRACVYGYFWPLAWKDVFDGTLCGATDLDTDFDFAEDLGGTSPINEAHGPPRRMWWSKWFK